MIDYVATTIYQSPLVAGHTEYQTGRSNPAQPVRNKPNPNPANSGSPYLQLVLAANILNNGYYGWRSGRLLEFEDAGNILIRPDPWQNAGSVAIQYYYATIFSGDEYALATGPVGLVRTYTDLFGNPWVDSYTHIPGSLQQPDFMLPFQYD